jgi:phage repressor protein C with HTH and peptisase S24 domain
MNNNINKRITFSRKSKCFTQKILAEKLNISLPTMNHYETGKRIPGSDLLARLAKVVECDPGWLLTGEGAAQKNKKSSESSPDPAMEGFILVPRYNIEASAGGGSIVRSEQIVDHLAFKKDWVYKELGTDPKNLLLVHSMGDSMEPTIRSGDLLLVDRNKSQIKGDGIYLINLDDGLMVKRVEWLLGGSVVVRGDNTVVSKEQTLSSTDLEKLHILGRVVWVGSKV